LKLKKLMIDFTFLYFEDQAADQKIAFENFFTKINESYKRLESNFYTVTLLKGITLEMPVMIDNVIMLNSKIVKINITNHLEIQDTTNKLHELFNVYKKILSLKGNIIETFGGKAYLINDQSLNYSKTLLKELNDLLSFFEARASSEHTHNSAEINPDEIVNDFFDERTQAEPLSDESFMLGTEAPYYLIQEASGDEPNTTHVTFRVDYNDLLYNEKLNVEDLCNGEDEDAKNAYMFMHTVGQNVSYEILPHSNPIEFESFEDAIKYAKDNQLNTDFIHIAPTSVFTYTNVLGPKKGFKDIKYLMNLSSILTNE
jgi:hypothetical protein